MGLLVSIAFLFLGAIVASMAIFVCGAVAFRQGSKVSVRLLGRCLVAALPLAGSMVFLFYVFGWHDPLWPDQDMTQDRYVVWRQKHEFSETLYDVAAVLCGLSFSWLLFRVVKLFSTLSRGANQRR